LKIAIVGSKELSCQILETCLKQGHEVVAVFSRDSEPGMKVWHSELNHRSLQNLATKNGLKVYEGFKINNAETQAILSSLELDIIFSCFWSEIFRESTLNIPKLGVFNIHSGYLPKYRGSRPIPWSIIKGERNAGITLHKMMSGVDNGPIVDQIVIEATEKDTAETIYERLTLAAAEMFERALPTFSNNTFQLKLQNETEATYFPPGEPFGGRINPFWNSTLKDRFERAFSFEPFSGAKPFLNKNISTSINIAFVNDGNCFVFDEDVRLESVSSAGPLTKTNFFKFLIRTRTANQLYFLTKPFGNALKKGHAIFHLKKRGFQAILELQSKSLKDLETWKSQPHFIENGHIKFPVFNINDSNEFDNAVDALEKISKAHDHPVFMLIKTDSEIEAVIKNQKHQHINFCNTETVLDLFN
jgi:methionyl-tRNA formyltransferase